MTDGAIPENAEERKILLERIEEFKAVGNREEAASALIDLAHLVKHIGPVTEVPWYQEYHMYVREAFQLLEGSTNKELLARAHRAVNLPFTVEPEMRASHLQTALNLSRECDDLEGQGLALYQMSHLDRDNSRELLDQARECFEKAGSNHGLALVLQTSGVQSRDLPSRERGDLLLAAAKHFGLAQEPKNKSRALMMALVFGGKTMTAAEIEAVGSQCVEACREFNSIKEEAHCYRYLSRLFKRRKHRERAQKYAIAEDSLDVALYGSRLGRLESDLEMIKENLQPPATKGQARVLRAQAAKIKKEIAELEEKSLAGGRS